VKEAAREREREGLAELSAGRRGGNFVDRKDEDRSRVYL